MKTLWILAISFLSFSAAAEYDKVYCGKIKRVADVPAMAASKNLNFNYVIDMTETCVFSDPEDVTYAGINATGTEVTELEKIITTSRSSTRWCVDARWSGSNPCIYASGAGAVATRTEIISRIGRRSSFGELEDDLE